MTEINLITAFVAGLLSFLAPCTFIALPAFISYLVYQATGEDVTTDQNIKKFRFKIFMSSFVYVVGFLTVFVLLGVTATSIGQVLFENKALLEQIGAIAIILFGFILLFADRVKALNFVYQERKFTFKTNKISKSYIYPLIIGITSAFAWSPCIGPILGGILFLAGTSSETVWQGGFLLFVYGLGITFPFIIISLFISQAQGIILKLTKLTKFLHKLTAVLLILLGIGILTGAYDKLYGLFLVQLTRIGIL